MDDFFPHWPDEQNQFDYQFISLVGSGFYIIFPEISLFILLAAVLSKSPLCTSLNVVSFKR